MTLAECLARPVEALVTDSVADSRCLDVSEPLQAFEQFEERQIYTLLI